MGLVIIKPDAFTRRLVGVILTRLETLSPIRKLYSHTFSPRDCDVHYKDHIGRSYYGALCDHMQSGTSLILEINADWHTLRVAALEIRCSTLMGCEGPKNLIHAPDSEDAEARESTYWLPVAR